MGKMTIHFGKSVEHFVFSKLLESGMDVYVPLADDKGIDALIRMADGSFLELQIKGRSKGVQSSDQFARIKHTVGRPNYWFVFHTWENDENFFWIVPASVFEKQAHKNNAGENKGKWTLDLNKKTKKILDKYKINSRDIEKIKAAFTKKGK
ncbi:MAG: hypothetical protein MdMp014T_1640 [Treponematales bacterium]